MRKASIAVFITLSFLSGLGLLPQDPVQDEQDEQDEDEITTDIDNLLAPFTDYREEGKKADEELLVGAWRLTTLETRDDRIDTRTVRGFAHFHDGYMTFVLIGEQIVEGFLTLEQVETQIQAGMHRYQISDLLTLQTASIMGFSNPDLSLIFDEVNEAREFFYELDETELRLTHPRGHKLVFQRMGTSAFPVEALRALERKRAGRDTTPDFDPDDPFNDY